MAKILSIHSFRGGTGKSNIVANIAGILADQGRRIGVVDADIQSPGIHILFGMEDPDAMQHSLNDYLWGKCDIREAAYDVTSKLGAQVSGQVYLIPSSIKPGEIGRVLREGYEVRVLKDGIRRLIQELNLDFLLIDTHPGLNEETLLSIAISDSLGIIMRPDRQDYQGTGVTVQVARRLKVKRMVIIVNKIPETLVPDQVRAETEETYNCEVAAVLPHSEEWMALASGGIFALRFPEHSLTAELKRIAANLAS